VLLPYFLSRRYPLDALSLNLNFSIIQWKSLRELFAGFAPNKQFIVSTVSILPFLEVGELKFKIDITLKVLVRFC
jgi:hypothetical protein